MQNNWTPAQKNERATERSEFLQLNPHYLVTYHIFQLRDLSGNNPENIPPLENGEYIQLMLDINSAVRIGALIISVYTDASGINCALDSNGNQVKSRFLKSTSYEYPYIYKDGNYRQGELTCIFGDGSTFTEYDDITNNDTYWYNINGISDPNNLNQYT